MQANGTLGIFVPFKRGLVIAADKRVTIDGSTFCDGLNKISILTNTSPIALILTGRRGFYPPRLVLANNICDYVLRESLEINFAEIAKAFVEKSYSSTPLAQFDFTVLSRHCIENMEQFFAEHPYRNPLVARDRFSSTFNFASYESSAGSLIRRFVIEVSADFTKISMSTEDHTSFGDGSISEPIIVGETDFVFDHVLPNIMSEPVSAETKEQLRDYPDRFNFPKVADRTETSAVQLAVDLITAAARTTARVAASTGIGGGVDIEVLR